MTKKIIYDSIYKNYCDFNNSISICVSELPKLNDNDEIDIDCYDGGANIIIYRLREETDEEYKKRIENEELKKEKMLEFIKIQKKKQYLYFKEQYESLKNEFEV